MERKTTRLRVISEEENDEDEEDWNRRISPRKKMRVRYIEHHDDDDDEEEEEEEEDENEQPGPFTHNTHNQRTQGNNNIFDNENSKTRQPYQNGLLPVTCGNKKGFLDIEKLRWGEECIKCEGCWFSGPAFEDLGGKGSYKKWKASIFHENKPLQFWFEQGSLTTKGFKRRGNKTTKKMLSSNRASESPTKESEIQSAEDEVSDEDSLPGSEELPVETGEGEEERLGAEIGGEVVDSGVDKSEEVEDEMEKGEMEDEVMPAVADNDKDNSVSEDRESEWIISASAKIRENALQKKVKVVIKRLPECALLVMISLRTIEYCSGDSVCAPVSGKEGFSVRWHGTYSSSWCKPLDRDVQNKEEREHKGSATDDPSSITASTYIDPPQMSHQTIGRGTEEERVEEFTQSSERKEDGQREINTETGNYPAPLTAPVTSSLDIRSTRNLTTNLSSAPVLLTGLIGYMKDDTEEREETGRSGEEEEEEGPETQRRWIKGFEDEHLDNMSRSEAGGQPLQTGNTRDAASNTSPMQRGIKEEGIQAMSGGLPTKSQSIYLYSTPGEYKYENRDATTSGHDGAGLQVMGSEKGVAQITQVSDSTPSSRPSSSSDLDTMDLDQLRREKIKMQLKVLKLQEEYYTQKMKQMRGTGFTGT